MDRDNAIKLLKGGREGLAEWIRRRVVGEPLPDLSEADLAGAGLCGAKLSEAKFNEAKFNEATLSGDSLGEATAAVQQERRRDEFPSSHRTGHKVASRGEKKETFAEKWTQVTQSVPLNRGRLIQKCRSELGLECKPLFTDFLCGLKYLGDEDLKPNQVRQSKYRISVDIEQAYPADAVNPNSPKHKPQ
jgi:Pentapeptide repeats (8 copies)